MVISIHLKMSEIYIKIQVIEYSEQLKSKSQNILNNRLINNVVMTPPCCSNGEDHHNLENHRLCTWHTDNANKSSGDFQLPWCRVNWHI
jgi:hypothetical protein